ncbi:GntR family transcriptional regulator [Microbacterium paludicola]|uniref:GntR family transcriptional regulator n=1 Tax=Microbacterium paludicola TaxID=300019 RepID=A0A4Y9FU13_9MICO|nr:GntR family transcriptional regulator [Microbacterium paludicola]MBF0817276.1 GntR family transcriptional regulator [Microbacterium paludicola]TFU31983.1 GntR family transcriptional regulator [Microbacterium paludicola]
MMKSTVEVITRSPSLRDHVEEALASAIISGGLAPGELLTAPTLAQRFGVSATPVREAMLNLQKRGFVEPVRNKGFRVTDVSEEDLRTIVEVRLMLEPPAMARLAGDVPAGDVDGLRGAADRIVQGAAAGDLAAYLTADTAFHISLTDLLGNQRLTNLIAELRAQTRLPGLAGMLSSEELTVSAQEHHELLDLLVAGKAREAESLMRRHISHVIGWWAGRPET